MTEQQEPLSDFWRKRRSTVLEEELVNVLNGARGYVGFFGSNFSIDWGRPGHVTVTPSMKRIELDYSPLKDKPPPYSGEDMDIVMGTAIHECGHIKWSYPPEKVRQYYASKKGHYTRKTRYGTPHVYLHPEEEQEASELQTIANVIEDFYVENKISETYPTLGAYLREARKLATKSEIPHNLLYDLSTDNPSYDSLVTMWGAIALIDKTIPDTASKTTKKLLNKLINYTIQTAGAKPEKRLQISYQIWDELKSLERARQREWQRQVAKSKQEREKRDKQEGDSNGKKEKSSETEDSDKQSTDEEQSADDTSKDEPEKEDTEKTESGKDKPEPEEREDETEEDKQPSDEEQEAEKETPSDSGQDTEPESRSDTEELEEDLDEPYQSHEDLRDCYSIDLNDKESMPADLKNAVDIYLERMPENITQQVDQILGGGGGREITMELAGADPKTANKYFLETRRIAQRVSKLFIYDKKLRTRYRRGLFEGAVDPRRLYRAGTTDYKLFERKEVLAAPSLAVGILVDASGSMSWGAGEEKLKSALKTAMALKTALSMIEGTDLMVTAYNSAHVGTTLYRVHDRKTEGFRPSVRADGGTPSGIAISGMITQIGRYLIGKDKLIIHITDGAPNSHEDVAKAVDYCKEHKIDVMTLTLERFTDEVIQSYRGLCEYLDNIDKLPDAIASLLKKRLQKRMMRIR